MTPAIPTTPDAYPPGYVPPVAPAAPPAVVPVTSPEVVTGPPPVRDEEIRLYGHSTMFYWWPVWAVGFLMAALTYLDGHRMAIVPDGTRAENDHVLVAPAGQTLPPASAKSGDPEPRLRVAANNTYGVVFAVTLLVVILVTNLILRGLSSVIALALIVITAMTFALLGWWDNILYWLGGVDIRMNAGGYVAIAVPLFVIWLVTTFIYDHYTYLIVTRGQVRIRKEIGAGEIAVDASGLSLEKKRDDLFRHWLIGLGSGDLHVKTGGPANLDFELNNVLFIGWKLQYIQDKIREKEVAHQTEGA